MEKRRTPFIVALAAASLGLLAACSDDADRTPDAPVEQVTPGAGTPPADAMPSSPAPSSAPDTGMTTPPPVESTSPPVGGDSAAGSDPVPGTTPAQ